MKRTQAAAFFAGALTASILTATIGCQTVNTVNDPAFVESADRFVNQTVGPEYEIYVMQDPELGTPGESTPLREDRLRNVAAFRAVVQSAQAELNELPPGTVRNP